MTEKFLIRKLRTARSAANLLFGLQSIAASKSIAIGWKWLVLFLVAGLFSSCASLSPRSVQPTSSALAPATAVPSDSSNLSIPKVIDATPELDITAWLDERVADKNLHAALIETLKPGKVFVAHNANAMFNPASLVKLATTLAALKHFDPEHRFSINVFADGELDKAGVLHGDLYFAGSAPIFNEISADSIADEFEARGIKRITGKIYLSPDFSFNLSESAERSARLFAPKLRFDRTPPTAIAAQPFGTELFVFHSQTLREILLYMNTRSSNAVAHKIGDALGGAAGLRQFLINELKLSPPEVKLETASGLGDNGMTARGILAILRALDTELKQHNLQPADVLPLAGESTSTLRRRLNETELQRATVGKTGTLSSADGGVGIVSLAGYIYTENNDTVAFVLLDEGGELFRHRELQDELLRAVFSERVVPRTLDVQLPRNQLAQSMLRVESRGELSQTTNAAQNRVVKTMMNDEKQQRKVRGNKN